MNNSDRQNKAEVLLVGDVTRCEFRDVVSSLTRGSVVVCIADLSRAVTTIQQRCLIPSNAVLLQTHSGQYRQEDLQRLRLAAPLVRIIVVAGTWSEGEQRSGTPLRGVQRVYAHQWIARMSGLLLDDVTSTALPATADAEEQLLLARATPAASGIVAIHAVAHEARGALSDICRRAGYEIIFCDGSGKTADCISAAIFDLTLDSPHERDGLRAFILQVRPAPVVVTLGFPRPDQIGELRQLGVSAVVGKPFMAHDLLWELMRASDPDQPLKKSTAA